MVQIVQKSLAWIKPDPNQPRKHFDEDELRRLGESLKVRQNDPVQAQPDGTLIDGERRWRAGKLVGLESLLVIITEKPLTPQELAVTRLTTFFHRADLSHYERLGACKELLRLHPGWRAKDLCDHLHVDPGTMSKILAADKVCGPVLEAFAAGKIGPSEVYAISKAETEAEQLELLAAKLSGATRDQIEKKRGGASRAASQVKLARVRCPLSTGATVTVAGDEMSLEDLIEALSAALDAARKAVKESLDVKTAQRVWADKAKAGA